MRNIKLGEQNLQFRFTLRDIIKFEKKIGAISQLEKMLADNVSKSIEVAATILSIGLTSANKAAQIDEEVTVDQALDLMDEDGLEAVQIVFDAFSKETDSSAHGKKKTGSSAKVKKIG